jgi:hypothetical protein
MNPGISFVRLYNAITDHGFLVNFLIKYQKEKEVSVADTALYSHRSYLIPDFRKGIKPRLQLCIDFQCPLFNGLFTGYIKYFHTAGIWKRARHYQLLM